MKITALGRKMLIVVGLILLTFMFLPLMAFPQASPYSNNVFKAQVFTATGQTGSAIQLNGLVVASNVGSSYASGTITVVGTSLSTATFSVQGSSDGGANYYNLPVSPVSSPGSYFTAVTVTANGLYQVNLAGITHVRFVTSGTFTATNVSLTLTASPNGSIAKSGGNGGGVQIAGDLGGTVSSPEVVGIQGVPVATAAPQRGQLMSFDGTHYVPVNFQVPMYGSPGTGSATLAFSLSNNSTTSTGAAVHGDSFNKANHQAGGASSGPLLEANMWTEVYRAKMQEIVGSHGTGLFPVIYAAIAGGIEPLSWSCSGTWDNTSNLNLGPTQSGVGTLVYLAPGASCSFTDHRFITYANVSVYYATADNTNTLTLTADSGTSLGAATATNASATGVTHNGYTARRFDSPTTLPLSTHTIHVSNSGSSGAWLYGIEGIAQPGGFALHNMAVGGARADMFGSDPTNQLAFDALIPGGVQGEIAMDMTNDLGQQNPSLYQTYMQNWVTAAKALPGSPSVMLAIPPVDIVSTGYSATGYLAAQRSICSTNNLQCADAAALRGDTYVSTDFDQSGTTWPGGSGGVHYVDAVGRTIAQLVLAKTLNPQPSTSGGCSTGCTFAGATTLNGQTNGTPLTATSDSASGTTMLLKGTASGVHSWGFQTDAFGHVLGGDFTTGTYGFEFEAGANNTGFLALNSNERLGWRSGSVTTDSNGPDTAFTRTGPGAAALGNGSAGDATGSLAVAHLTGVVDINGAAPGTSGGCSTGCTFGGQTTLSGGTNGTPLSVTSASAGGTVFLLQGSATGVNTWGFQSDATGQWLAGNFTNGQYGFEMRVGAPVGGVVPGYMALGPGELIGWRATSVTTDGVGPDTALARVGPGAVAPSNGTSGNISGVYSGPATAPTGSCSVVGWQFTQDGHATFCNGSTWVTKI